MVCLNSSSFAKSTLQAPIPHQIDRPAERDSHTDKDSSFTHLLNSVDGNAISHWCSNSNSNSNNMTSIRQRASTSINVEKRDLPLEILIEIFHHVADCQPTLYNISLVCKQWFYGVATFMYRCPKMRDTYSWATFILSLTRKKKFLAYGDFIRSVDLSARQKSKDVEVEAFFKKLTTRSTSVTPTFSASNNTHVGNTNSSTNAHTDMAAFDSSSAFESSMFKPAPISKNAAAVEEDSHTSIVLTTSSLLQLSQNCRYITHLDLSNTSLLRDSYIVETGEFYYSSSRKSGIAQSNKSTCRGPLFQVAPATAQSAAAAANELNYVKIHIEQAIQSLGENCPYLEDVKLRNCEWVTVRIIWLFAKYCLSLIKLDARGSTRCVLRRLIDYEVEVPPRCRFKQPAAESLIESAPLSSDRKPALSQVMPLLSNAVVTEPQDDGWVSEEEEEGNDYLVIGASGEDMSLEDLQELLLSLNPLRNNTVFVVVHSREILCALQRSRFNYGSSSLSSNESTAVSYCRLNAQTNTLDIIQGLVSRGELLSYRWSPVQRLPYGGSTEYQDCTSLKHMVFGILKAAKQTTHRKELAWFNEFED